MILFENIPKGIKMKKINLFILSVVFSLPLLAGETNSTKESQTIQEIEKLRAEIAKNSQDIKNKMDKIQYDHKNIIVIYKDIDTLYDFVIGGDYTFKKMRYYPSGNIIQPQSCDNNASVLGIDTSTWFPEWLREDFLFNKNGNKIKTSVGAVDRFKLLAIEEKLSINEDGNDTNDTVSRIKNIYEKINFNDWDRDRIQFTVMEDYIAKEPAALTSVGILVFPSYKKSIPGNLDLTRRYALYFAIGSASAFDNQISFNSAVYSAGINIEIQKGFGLHAGWTYYSLKNSTVDQNFHAEDSFIFGVTLSSELWKNLFNLKSAN